MIQIKSNFLFELTNLLLINLVSSFLNNINIKLWVINAVVML